MFTGASPSSKRPRRIALFTASLGCGGAERMMIQLARGMVAAGVPLDLVVTQAAGPLASAVPAEARLIDLAAPRMRRAIPALARYLRRERPQAMLSRVLHANLAALVACRIARTDTRLVLTEASTLSAVLAGGLIGGTLAIVARRLYPMADMLVAVSRGASRDLDRFLKLPAGRVRTIYNPVVDESLHRRAAEACEHPWLTHAGEPVLLSVGRLSSEKDHATLLEAVAIVRRTRAVRLVIFGEGNERPRLEALRRKLGLEAAVDLPGIIGNPYAAMSRASLFVLSSRIEGLPNALIEAMACGCPVVSTDCPSGPAEIVTDPRHGLLVPMADPPALARAILAALEQTWDRAALKARGAEFSLAKAVPQYLEALGYPAPSLAAAEAA